MKSELPFLRYVSKKDEQANFFQIKNLEWIDSVIENLLTQICKNMFV